MFTIAMENETRIRELFRDKYPDDRKCLGDFLADQCLWFVGSHLADHQFIDQLCSGKEASFQQRLSEVLFAYELCSAEIEVVRGEQNKNAGGPDFLIEHNRLRIWVEVTCPEPSGIQGALQKLGPDISICKEYQPDEHRLRWTSAIAAKLEQWVRHRERNVREHRPRGPAGDNDAYVIAVNGRRLRAFADNHSFYDINGLPFAVTATLGFGDNQVEIDHVTLLPTSAGFQHRPCTPKPNRCISVRTDVFWTDKWKPVSAIWAADMDGSSRVFDNSMKMSIIHNPLAAVPLPCKLLPACDEYLAAQDAAGFHHVYRCEGRLR